MEGKFVCWGGCISCHSQTYVISTKNKCSVFHLPKYYSTISTHQSIHIWGAANDDSVLQGILTWLIIDT